MPNEAITHADSVVIGEGELTLLRSLEDFKKDKLQPQYRMPYMVPQWDEKPPRWDLLPPGYMFRDVLTATRGCTYRCSFYSIRFDSIHLAADSAPINVYRDMNHLSPQEEPVAYRFPYPPKRRFSFITDRLDQLRSKVQPRPRINKS